MRKARFIQLMLTATIGFLFSNPSTAESSKDYAVMARASWSALECSSLASKSKNFKEQERLFLHGYDQGQKFIAAVKSEKVKREDLSTEAPLMMLLLQGPTADFMLAACLASTIKIS